MLSEAIKMAKGDEEEKAMTSVSMPKSVKENLVELAQSNKVSVNSLIVSILITALKGDSLSDDPFKQKVIIMQINELNKRKESIFKYFEDIGGLDPELESDTLLNSELKGIESTLETLEGLLK